MNTHARTHTHTHTHTETLTYTHTLLVDFSKANDCVDRKKLVYLLIEKVGFYGKMFKALNAMYSEVK